MSFKIKAINEDIKSAYYGNKAYWLSWLHRNGYNVPYAIFLPVIKAIDTINELEIDEQCLSDLLPPMLVGDDYDVAIRSSATCEDTDDDSLAGHFKTIIGRMKFEGILYSIKQVINSLAVLPMAAKCKMGTIIQKLISPQFSGVIASSNPLNGEIGQSVVSVIVGIGMNLVSGHLKGEDITLRVSKGKFDVSSHTTPITKHNLFEIWQVAKSIEEKLGQPVGIEWCIEKETNILYILQCRPLTGILRNNRQLIHVSQANANEIPASIINNEKVSIRLLSEKYGVGISTAYLAFINRSKKDIEVPFLDTIQPSSPCKSYSVVLIQPEVLSGKVVRAFTGIDSLKDTVAEIGRLASNSYWLSTVIIQEIFDAEYTGMVRKIDDGYVIELARGHFIPKGVIATSQYIVDTTGGIKDFKEVNQDFCLKIINGEIEEQPIPGANSLITISKRQIKNILQSFAPFLSEEGISVEFGILKPDKENPIPIYLIDLTYENGNTPVDSNMIKEGVISKGLITGKLVKLSSTLEITNLNMHFHDQISFNYRADVPEIFLCDSPDISLLKTISAHNPHKIGFIFKDAAVLCHLAILLREKGIPAIQTNNYEKLKTGDIVTVDALTPGLESEKRVISQD